MREGYKGFGTSFLRGGRVVLLSVVFCPNFGAAGVLASVLRLLSSIGLNSRVRSVGRFISIFGLKLDRL